jgi:DNA-binding response OmpR family regulator
MVSPLAPSHVLLIDDSPDFVTFMTTLLDGEGYRVSACSTGRAALSWLATQSPDLLILDLHLSDMDGHTLLAQLDGDLTTQAVPVLVCSGAVDQVEELAARWAGPGRATLVKPFDIEDVLTQVRLLLAARHPVAVE